MWLRSDAEELSPGSKIRFAMGVQRDIHGADGFEDQVELGSRGVFLQLFMHRRFSIVDELYMTVSG